MQKFIILVKVTQGQEVTEEKNDENVTCGQEVGREAWSKSGLFSERHTF